MRVARLGSEVSVVCALVLCMHDMCIAWTYVCDAVLKDPLPALAAQRAVCWIYGFRPPPVETPLTPGLPQTVANTFYEGIPRSGPTACA